jgi:3-oxoacyl-[acyl-carrier protein] reductase
MMTNRVAFVSGASRGIGRACALELARTGARVVLAARDRAKLEQTAAEAPGSYIVEMDLSQPDSIKEAFAKTAKDFGAVTILVNNAAITRDTFAVRMKRDDWDAVLQTNLTGSFLCCQQVLPGMMRERWGRIVNISSVVGESGNAGQVNYAASKAGLIGLTKSLAQEMASRNITVNAVTPGFIDTDMTAVLSQEVKEGILARIPLKRLGTPGDVASAVRFLASDEASYITGHVLSVNGGMYM